MAVVINEFEVVSAPPEQTSSSTTKNSTANAPKVPPPLARELEAMLRRQTERQLRVRAY